MTILAIGEILVEIVATTVGCGFGEAQPLVGPFPSGAPAIFAAQVGRLGHRCAIVGRVGDDDFGRLNLDRLRADGVDVSAVEVASGEVTGCAFVRYRANGSRAFLFTLPQSAAATLPPTDAGRAAIAACEHLHVMGSALAAPGVAGTVMAAVEAVTRRGGTLSFDPNLRPELLSDPAVRDRLRHVLARAGTFLPSQDEVVALTDAPDEAAAVEALLAGGVHEVVVKRGARGASCFSRGACIDIAGHAVEEVDPTGAGDCFGATFVAMRRAGADPDTALRHANAAGALAVTRLGPMEGAPTRGEIDAFLAEAAA